MTPELLTAHDTCPPASVHDRALSQDARGEGAPPTWDEADGSGPDEAAPGLAGASTRSERAVAMHAPREDLSHDGSTDGLTGAAQADAALASASGDLDAITSEIRRCLRRAASDVLDIGANLLRAKALVGHGSFGAYLKSEFDMSERTAERYMLAAQRFAGNSDIVSNLPQALIYKLAAKSTPEAVISEVIERGRVGQPMSPMEVQARLSAARADKDAAGKEAHAPSPVGPQPGEAGVEVPDRLRPPKGVDAAQKAASLLAERLGDDLQMLLTLLDDCKLDQVV